MQFYVRKRKPPTINIVSLIDVLAILLIFFIVTTTFRKQQPQVEISLPKSSTAKEAKESKEPALLSIKDAANVELDGRRVTLADLERTLKALRTSSPDRALALQIDKSVPFELVIKVLDALKQAGVTDLPAFTEKSE